MKRVVVLGSTGSIGVQTLDVIKKSGRFRVVGLSAGRNIDLLEKQILEFQPLAVSVFDEEQAEKLRRRVGNRVKVFSGDEGNIEIVEIDADIVVAAIVGSRGVYPVLRALELGRRVALANKESLVVAGHIVKEFLRRYGGELIPVDSEHSAIFQALQAGNRKDVRKIILTASGGPFRTRSDLDNVTVEEALKHPTWSMGKKITIDSATLFNKGLEIIEAHYLFDVEPENIEVVIHPQSIVHSMVEFKDGSIMAQLGPPDMRIPISYALFYPERWMNTYSNFSLLDRKLEFYPPDFEKFPALKLAYRVLREGEKSCFIYSQANEVAVRAFLEGRIKFTHIPRIVEKVLEMKDTFPEVTYDAIMKMEEMIKRAAEKVVADFEVKL